MHNPFLIFLVPASPLLAVIIDALKGRHSPLVHIVLLSVSILLAVPWIFTDYNYAGEFSAFLVISIISVLINICWMQYARRNVKLIIAFLLAFAAFIQVYPMFLGRAIAGGPTIYDVTNRNGYKVIHLRNGSPGILESDHFELYKTSVLGLLEKPVDYQYVQQDSDCQVILNDSTNKRIIYYNHCNDVRQIE